MAEQIAVEDAGYWRGEQFILHEPVVVLAHDGTVTMRTITVPKGMKLPDGMSRDDVVHAMLNPVHAKQTD